MVQRFGLVEGWTEESTGTLLANDRVSKIKECCKGFNGNFNKRSQINHFLTLINCRKPGDTSNFSDYPDSDKLSSEVPKKDDPFLDW
jgi:hypothetical protein